MTDKKTERKKYYGAPKKSAGESRVERNTDSPYRLAKKKRRESEAIFRS